MANQSYSDYLRDLQKTAQEITAKEEAAAKKKGKPREDSYEAVVANVRQSLAPKVTVDNAFLQKLQTDAKSFFDTGIKSIQDIAYGSGRRMYDDRASTIDDIRSRSNSAMSYLLDNREAIGEDNYRSARELIKSIQDDLNTYERSYKGIQKHFSQWDTEDAYNTAVKQGQWADKYKGKRASELTAMVDSVTDEEEKEWLKGYSDSLGYQERMDYDLDAGREEVNAFADAYAQAQEWQRQYNQYLNDPLMALTDGEGFRRAREQVQQIQAKYGSLQGMEQELQKKRSYLMSAGQTQRQVKDGEAHEAWIKTLRPSEEIRPELEEAQKTVEELKPFRFTGGDALNQSLQGKLEAAEQELARLEKEYRYSRLQEFNALAGNEDFAELSKYVSTQKAPGFMAKIGGVHGADMDYEFINRGRLPQEEQTDADRNLAKAMQGRGKQQNLQMTDEEVGIYNYLYATQGKEKAQEYLDVLGSDLTARERQMNEERIRAQAQAHPIAMSALSIALSPLKAAGFAAQGLDYLGDGKIDENAAYNTFSHTGTAIRDAVSQKIEQSGKWGPAGSFAYQTAMSMGDFLLNATIAGGSSALSLAVMGSGAAADTVISSRDRGLDDRQAFTLGTVAGIAEALTELFSLDALLDANLLKNGIAKYVIKNVVSEGSEEVASSIVNLFADIAVAGDRSEFRQNIQNYIMQGYSEGEAFGRAAADQAASLGMDFLGGALSGGIMGGAAGTGYYAQSRNAGQVLSRRGLQNPQAVQMAVDAGLNAPQGSTANAVAAQLQGKLDQGKQLSAYDKGRLYESNPAAVSEQVLGEGKVRLASPLTRGIDNRSEEWQQAQRLSVITGRNIVFFNGGDAVNGYYEPKTGEIYVNIDGADTVLQTVAHELTHSVEMADAYQDLAKFVRGQIIARGGDLGQMRKQKAESYARHGINLSTEAEIDAEIVAEYVQDYLLTDEQSIYQVAMESPTLGRKILNWIDGILAKMGNEKAAERKLMNDARSMYAKALDQSRGGQAEKVTAKQTAATDTRKPGYENNESAPQDLQEMKRYFTDQYNAGEITEEEYNSMMDAIEQEEMLGESEAGEGRRYSFAGEKAQTANRQKLQEAKELQAKGVANETIRQQTGWYKGMDGKWRYEIDDSQMEISKTISNYMRLGDLMQHEKLFAAYPDLADIDVVFQSLDASVNGSYHPQFDSINLSYKLKNDPIGLKDALVHEIQHAIQHREGFTNGATAASWERKIKAGFDSRRAADIWKAQETERVLRRIQKEEPEFYRDMVELDAMTPDLPRGEIDWETLEKIEDDPVEWQQYDARREELEAKYGDTKVWDMNDLLYQREQAAKNAGRTGVELYFDTAGEIEARDASNRRSKSPEQRKTSLPRLGNEDTVFADQTGISFDQAIAEYPYNMQTVIRDYVDSVDEKTLAFIEEVQSGVAWQGKKITVGTANSRMVDDIAALTGVENKVGCKIILNTNAVKHIQKRHGAHGEHDNTMRDNRDIARLDYILQNYDEMTPGKKLNAEFKNRDGTHSKTVVLSKKINGTYFVVEAVPDTGKITIVSAYMNKNGASQVLDAEAPGRDVQNVLASTPIDSVSNEDNDVKRKYSIDESTADEAESQTIEITRDALPSKAKDYLRRAESRMLNAIGDALSVPRYIRYNVLKNVVHEISDEYLKNGTVSDEKTAELFDRAYTEGIVKDAEFYNQYKHIKDHLRTTGVTISEQDRYDIADYKDFRKRATGTLRILNEGGLPVDVAYDELRGMAPELFPAQLTHPADQLMKMYDVARSIHVSEKSLDEFYGPERESFRAWARNDFDAAVGDIIPELKKVRRYTEEQGKRPEVKRVLTPEQAEQYYADMKKARREVEKVRAKNLLSDDDEVLLGKLLKGEIGEAHLNPDTDNVKGIMDVYRATLDYEALNEILREYKRSIRAKSLQTADEFLKTANTWKDKKSGFLYARETMRRNILDIVPDRKLAESIVEYYFESIHKAEAQATKFKTEFRDRVRALNLNTKVEKGNIVSEAHAVQLLGEAMDNIRLMEKSRGRMKQRDGMSYDDWIGVVQNLWAENPNLNRQRVEAAVDSFRKIYDELFKKMNTVRVANGYEPVNYRQGYFPHFQPGNGDGIIAYFGKILGIDTQVDALPTTINGLTHTFKPGIQWFGNAQQRLGYNTAYDAVEGFDKYIEGVASVIFQTENIQNLRALATQARYRTSDKGIQKQVDDIRKDDRLTDEEKQTKINEIFEHGKFALSNFVVELDEYTNLLANKKSKYDRWIEGLFSRKAYTVLKTWESQIGANMIAGNVSSALTNFIPLTQANAQMDSGMILRGMWDTLRAMKEDDGLAGMSDFLINRRGSDPLVKTWSQKWSAKAGFFMEVIDNFTSEAIVRAAYLQNRKRGMSEDLALHQADIFAANVMADRSKGSMPTLFESRNPVFKAFTQFQLEVNNQVSEVFKDLPRRYRGAAPGEKKKELAVLAAILARYFLGAMIYNALYEKLVGRRPAMDPFGILVNTADTWKEEGIGAAGAQLVEETAQSVPFIGGLLGGGRLPVNGAIPDFKALWEAATTEDWGPEKRWKEIQDELNKLAYVIPPFGGAQVSKIWKGTEALIKGGSYSVNNEGKDILQYPVYQDDPYTMLGNALRMAVLGKNSLETAQDWAKSGYKSLTAEETAIYRDMLDSGVKDRTAFEMINTIRGIDAPAGTAENEKAEIRRNLKKDYILKSSVSKEGKAILYYGMAASSTEQKWMDSLADAGADQADTLGFVHDLYEAESLKGTDKKIRRAEVFAAAPLTEEEKQFAVQFIMDNKRMTDSGNLTTYGKFLAAMESGLSVDKYMQMYSSEANVDDFLEMQDAGVSTDAAADITIKLGQLVPLEGEEYVSWNQECDVILNSSLSNSDQVAALQAVSYESTGIKIRIGYENGLAPGALVYLKRILPEFDENGNGSYSQKEVTAAIDAVCGDDNVLYALTGTTPHGFNLNNDQKAVLWQLQCNGKKNPYNQAVGDRIYQQWKSASSKDEEEDTTSSEQGIDLASIMIGAK